MTFQTGVDIQNHEDELSDQQPRRRAKPRARIPLGLGQVNWGRGDWGLMRAFAHPVPRPQQRAKCSQRAGPSPAFSLLPVQSG